MSDPWQDTIQQAADVIYDSWESWTEGGTKTGYCETLAAALAAASMLKAPDDEIVTPEQRAVLDAAIGLHECSGADDTEEANDPRLAEWTDRLYIAVDALRAATPKDGEG